MNAYRVCVDKDGAPLSVELRQRQTLSQVWLTGPDFVAFPDTPKDTTYIHYLEAADEMAAFIKAQQLKEEGVQRRDY